MKWNSNHENVHLQSALIRAPLCGRPTAIRPSARPTVHLFFWNIFYPFCLVLLLLSHYTHKRPFGEGCAVDVKVYSLPLAQFYVFYMYVKDERHDRSLSKSIFFTIAVNQLLFACANFCEVRGTLIIANFLAANQYSCVSCDLFVI